MKSMQPTQIAVVFTGSFLGAGFLSGQELLQFFGKFGGYGIAGMVLSISAFCLFSLLVLRIAKRTGFCEFDKIIVPHENRWLRGFFSGVFFLFLFSVMVSMIAGAGALLHQTFGFPVLVGNALMTGLVLLVAVTGTTGMLTSFRIVVPLLVLSALVIGVWALATLPPSPITPLPTKNPLLGNWFFSALSFLSYNMMAAISVLVPLSKGMEEDRAIHQGLALGTLLLTIIFVSILLPMLLYTPLVAAAELPMLALAALLSPFLGTLYAILLFLGMFTASLSSLFGIASRLQAKLEGQLRTVRFLLLLCVGAFFGSLFGFKNMVSFVFPLCGYIGFFSLVGILIHFRALRNAEPDTLHQNQV